METTHFQLREFQSRLTQRWVEECHTPTLVAANCGAGKTILAGALIKELRGRNGARALFAFDLKCLPGQAARDVARLGLSVGIYAAGHPEPAGSEDVILVMLQTLEAAIRRGGFNWAETFGTGIGLLIFDEVHDLVKRVGFGVLRSQYPGARQVGLTATPYRLRADEYLGQWFDQVLPAPQPGELIRQGLILPERVFVPKEGRIDEATLVTDATGDYSEQSQEKQGLKQASLDSVVSSWDRICPGIPAACYATTVRHAQALSDAFNRFFEANRDRYPDACAEWQDGTTKSRDRAAQFDRMRAGTTLVVVSVGTLTKGFDLDCIGAILFVRATKSRALYMQSAGRGCRILKTPHPAYPSGKSWYYLLAFSSVVDRFGAPSDYQDYSIDKPEDKPVIEYRKQCPECDHMCRLSATSCEHCGYVFPKSVGGSEEITPQEVELHEHLTTENRRKVKLLKRARLEAFFAGTPPADWDPAVGHVPDSWYKGLIFGDTPKPGDREDYQQYLLSTGLSATEVSLEMMREFGHVE